MNTKHLLVRAAIWLGVFVIPLAMQAESTPDDLAAAQRQADEARVALDTARDSLSAVQAAQDKNNRDLSEAYYVLNDEVRRDDREGEKESRETIKTMNAAKERLWAERDRAKLLVAQREAELGSAQALVRVHRLQVVASSDPAEINRWQKMHEKALSKARRLEREREGIPAEPGQENIP